MGKSRNPTRIATAHILHTHQSQLLSNVDISVCTRSWILNISFDRLLIALTFTSTKRALGCAHCAGSPLLKTCLVDVLTASSLASEGTSHFVRDCKWHHADGTIGMADWFAEAVCIGGEAGGIGGEMGDGALAKSSVSSVVRKAYGRRVFLELSGR
jgi:hypothetical protein